jgi:hypothetical protein
MTLLDAKEYDPRKERRRNIIIASIIIAVLILGALAWFYRYWPEEHVADKFFAALQKQDYEAAYAIWMHDPQWKQHTQKYSQYSFNDFYKDWGPGGEWGLIKSYKIYASGTPPGGSSSGVIVEVVVNGRAEHARVWVEKSDKTMSFSPY